MDRLQIIYFKCDEDNSRLIKKKQRILAGTDFLVRQTSTILNDLLQFVKILVRQKP